MNEEFHNRVWTKISSGQSVYRKRRRTKGFFSNRYRQKLWVMLNHWEPFRNSTSCFLLKWTIFCTISARLWQGAVMTCHLLLLRFRCFVKNNSGIFSVSGLSDVYCQTNILRIPCPHLFERKNGCSLVSVWVDLFLIKDDSKNKPLLLRLFPVAGIRFLLDWDLPSILYFV